jgi:hypothetical protein
VRLLTVAPFYLSHRAWSASSLATPCLEDPSQSLGADAGSKNTWGWQMLLLSVALPESREAPQGLPFHLQHPVLENERQRPRGLTVSWCSHLTSCITVEAVERSQTQLKSISGPSHPKFIFVSTLFVRVTRAVLLLCTTMLGKESESPQGSLKVPDGRSRNASEDYSPMDVAS